MIGPTGKPEKSGCRSVLFCLILYDFTAKNKFLVGPTDFSAGNGIAGISRGLRGEIVSFCMDDHSFTDNFIDGKAAVKKGHPGIALVG